MADYKLSRRAIRDLTEIWIYTVETWSEKQADQYYHILTDAVVAIACQPGLGKSYMEIDSGLFGFRVGQHIIFYRNVPAKSLEIIRILHVRMDLKSKM